MQRVNHTSTLNPSYCTTEVNRNVVALPIRSPASTDSSAFSRCSLWILSCEVALIKLVHTAADPNAELFRWWQCCDGYAPLPPPSPLRLRGILFPSSTSSETWLWRLTFKKNESVELQCTVTFRVDEIGRMKLINPVKEGWSLKTQ